MVLLRSSSVRSNHSGSNGHPAIQMVRISLSPIWFVIVADKSTSYLQRKPLQPLCRGDRGAGGQLIEVPMIDASLAFSGLME